MTAIRSTQIVIHNPASHAAGPLRDPGEFGEALRILEEQEATTAAEPATRFPLTDGATLSEFFERWYRPTVLVTQERAAGTCDNYEDTLQLWCLVTCDPPLRDINSSLLAAFVMALKTIGFRRAPDGEARAYSAVTIRNHLAKVMAILNRAGCAPRHGGPCARILAAVPGAPQVKCQVNKKFPFTLDEARRIAAACNGMTRPRVPDGQRPLLLSAGKWWKALIALLFYTGLRVGSIYQLRWRDIDDDRGQLFINVRAQTTKTGKSLRLAIHPQLGQVLKLKAGVSREHLILPQLCNKRTTQDHHKELQRLAGLKPIEMGTLHTWRRTHGQHLAELGLENAEKLASLALDHGGVAVTKASYIDVVDRFRLNLPDLWPQGVNDETQLTFF